VRPHARGCGAGARWGRGSAVVRPVGALSARTGAIAAGGPLRVDMLAAGAAGGRDHSSGMGSHGRTGVREAQAGGRLGRYASGGEPSSKCPSKRLSECPFRHRWRNGPVAGAHGWFADRHVVHFRLVVLSFGCSPIRLVIAQPARHCWRRAGRQSGNRRQVPCCSPFFGFLPSTY
jgi:hypothetical protein